MKCKLRIFDADDESVCLARWIEATQLVVREGQLPIWHFNYQFVKAMERPDLYTMDTPPNVCPVGYALVNEVGKEFHRCWFDRRVYWRYGERSHISYNSFGRLSEPEPSLLLPEPPLAPRTPAWPLPPFSEATATGARIVIRTGGIPPLPDQPNGVVIRFMDNA